MQTAVHAAAGRHHELLLWALAAGCPWDERIHVTCEDGAEVPLREWALEGGVVL